MKKFSASKDRKLATEASVLYFVIGILFLFFLISCNNETTDNQKNNNSQLSDSISTNVTKAKTTLKNKKKLIS